MGKAGGLLAALLFAGYGWAQTGRTTVGRGSMTANTKILRSGCPAPVPPVASDAGATATDWIELRREGCAGACPRYRVRVGEMAG